MQHFQKIEQHHQLCHNIKGFCYMDDTWTILKIENSNTTLTKLHCAHQTPFLRQHRLELDVGAQVSQRSSCLLPHTKILCRCEHQQRLQTALGHDKIMIAHHRRQLSEDQRTVEQRLHVQTFVAELDQAGEPSAREEQVMRGAARHHVGHAARRLSVHRQMLRVHQEDHHADHLAPWKFKK